MSRNLTPDFRSPDGVDYARTGGKGANLCKLSQAGFPVPPGFVVITDAYDTFITANDLGPRIATHLASIDYDDSDSIARKAATIRSLIMSADLPADVAVAIAESYRAMGDGTYVAVRSSGTAEDLSETSFAGQHDTYLDVLGEAEVIDSVRACWASMWSDRVVAYRHQRGVSHDGISIAVVVQQMVPSEISGVLFTADPITGAVDQLVINSSWGLGEAIVSGIVTPDQYRLSRETLDVLSREIGSKAVQVIRDPAKGHGTIEQIVTTADRERLTLSDARVQELGKLAREVQAYYDDVPQDIEWGFASGKFYLLQSRDVTGVDISWDEDLDDPEWCPPDEPGITWTRAWGDAIWPGAVTPLFYSMRSEMITKVSLNGASSWSMDDVARMRGLKYHKGRAYFNALIDYEQLSRLLPPVLRRAEMLETIPQEWRKRLVAESWSLSDFLKRMARIKLLDAEQGPSTAIDRAYRRMREDSKQADGLPVDRIRALSDRELKRYLNSRIEAQVTWLTELWTIFWVHMRLASTALGWMLDNWYDGDNKMIALDLITGLENPTITLQENLKLWELSEIIRSSPSLRALFERNEGATFFDAVRVAADGEAFVTAYDAFIAEFGHRGHSDRDIHGKRRIEDPAIDYTFLRAMLSADAPPPDSNVDALVERRKAATEEVVASIRRHPPFANLKVDAFHIVHNWLLRFWALRDDERHFTDRITFSKKLAAIELGRRLEKRGLLEPDDFYFLSKQELFTLLDGGRKTRLVDLKIRARRVNYDRVDKEFVAPLHIRDGQYLDLNAGVDTAQAGDGVLRGQGTSRGTVTGIARIVPTQKDIGRVQKGDILITSATDPGWTPVFLVISGLVLETGGLLAHGSCISREYGIPAVQLPDAMKLIREGSTISVNGDSGEVRVIAEPDDGTPAPDVSEFVETAAR